ncbi:M48 family metalloprotease [Phormidium sp. LEGE 05292]|uniref:M48 family metallopeptidase n=1 Tax=[Phormidium] sp. LEGE 05292 TaxID=767427 RepID=UPI00187E4C83|nr:M48 family metallopeptidase [Phormidium sp. LEGE 05292]MBE9230076.1 M48 family metalloprotease [Phormidium sp. LEGE 05292]
MLNPLSVVSSRSRRRWFYPLLSVMVALGLVLSPMSASVKALPWDRLLFQGVQVLQLSTISDRQEVQLGKQINDQMVGSQIRLYRNARINQYVDQVGQRLAAVSDRPNIAYTFQVVRDDSVNAFATMGGFVYVTTGLLATVDNEAQLASVLGHEIGHITERHALKQMRQAAITSGIATAAGVDTNRLVGLGVEFALNRPRSRSDELQADQRSLQMLAKAGYPQSALIAFLEKLLDQPSPPSILSTHPATRDRIAAIQKAIGPSNANTGYGLDPQAYRAAVQPLR